MDFILLLTVSFVLLVLCFVKNKLSLSSFVIFLYFLMIVFSLPASINSNDIDYNSGGVGYGSIIFSILLLTLLSPFLVINLNKVDYVRLPSEKIMNIIAYVSIISSFVSIIYFSYISLLVFSYENLVNFRHELIVDGHPFITPGLINTLSGIAATFYTIPVFMFYLYLLTGAKRSLSILLFISTLSYPLFVLAYFGRDGVLFWLISHISAYLVFKNSYPLILRNKLKKIILFFSLFGGFAFMFISVVRFDGADGAFLSMIGYLGQPAINFIDMVNFDFTITYGSRSFNMIYSFFSSNDYSSQFLYQLGSNIEMSWVFGTMLRNLYIDFGFLGTLLFLLVISLLFILNFISNFKSIKLTTLFVYFAYSQIVMQGVFYFRQSNDVGNLYIICLLLLPVLGMFLPFRWVICLKKEK
jgi:oligosaccharide repeat unit polymerase